MIAGSALAGRRVVNTRALSQAGELDRVLEANGAIPLSFPCIAIGPPSDVTALDGALERLDAGGFDWVVFTSVNAVEAVVWRIDGVGSHDSMMHVDGVGFIDRGGPSPREPARGSPILTRLVAGEHLASERRLDLSPRVQPRATAGTKVAAVGVVTTDAVNRLLGWPVAFVPEVETAVELGRTLPITLGDRVLLPQSALAGPALAAILSARGAEVTAVVAYETFTGAGGVDLASLLAAGAVDAVCFTSGSTVRGCLERLGGAGLPGAVRVACVGPETAEAARSLGLRVDIVPARSTMGAMVEALAASFAMNETAIWG